MRYANPRTHSLTDHTHQTIEQVAAVMVATGRIATAAQIIPLYSPGGANVHLRTIHGSLDPHESAPKRHIDWFGRFVGRTDVLNGEIDASIYAHRSRNTLYL